MGRWGWSGGSVNGNRLRKTRDDWELPGNLVVKTLHASNARDMGLIPGQGTKTPGGQNLINYHILLKNK